MRALVEDLASPLPIARQLPAIFQQLECGDPRRLMDCPAPAPEADPWIVDFVSGLDNVLSPVINTLDNLHAYFDPRLAPPDFLDWLLGWVRVTLEDGWSVERRRRLLLGAVRLYRLRSTPHGLRDLLIVYSGTEPDIQESGAVRASRVPGGRMPGSARAFLRVRVVLPNASSLEVSHLESIVAAAKPAHIPHTLEVVDR